MIARYADADLRVNVQATYRRLIAWCADGPGDGPERGVASIATPAQVAKIGEELHV